MTSGNPFSFEVAAGPSKFDLMTSLFKGKGETVVFRLDGSTRSSFFSSHIKVGISAVEREDASAESWNFRGCTFVDGDIRFFEVEGFYSTKTRTGHLTFLVPFCYVLEEGERKKVLSPDGQTALEEYVASIRN